MNTKHVLLSLMALGVSALSVKAQTKMLSVGWEAAYLHNSGANYFLPVNRAITIIGYSITFTVYPWNAQPAAALYIISVGSSPAVTGDLAHYPSAYYPYGMGDFSSAVPMPYGGSTVFGDIGENASIVRTVLKTHGDTVVKVCEANGLDIPVPAGSTIINHVDVSGADVDDCEVQGVIYYR